MPTGIQALGVVGWRGAAQHRPPCPHRAIHLTVCPPTCPYSAVVSAGAVAAAVVTCWDTMAASVAREAYAGGSHSEDASICLHHPT